QHLRAQSLASHSTATAPRQPDTSPPSHVLSTELVHTAAAPAEQPSPPAASNEPAPLPPTVAPPAEPAGFQPTSFASLSIIIPCAWLLGTLMLLALQTLRIVRLE